MTISQSGSAVMLGAAGQNPSAQNITVPAGTQLAVIFWVVYSSSANIELSSVSLGGQAATIIENTPRNVDASGTGVAVVLAPSTGTQGLDWAFSHEPTEGPVFGVMFLKADNGFDSNAVVDSGVTTSQLSSSIIDCFLDVLSTDFVCGLTTGFGGAGVADGDPDDDQTIVATHNFNSIDADLVFETTPIDGQVSIAGGGPWPSVAAIAIREAEGGGPDPMTVEPGDLGLTGNDVGMVQSFLLPVDAGSIEATGNDVGMSLAFGVGVDPASLEVEGSDVGMTLSLAVDVDPASLEVEGSDVGLRQGFVFAVEPGALELDSADVGMFWSRVFEVEPGALELEPSDVGMSLAQLFPVEPGDLGLTGNDVGMAQSFLLPVEPGAIEATGNDVEMAHLTDFTLQVDPASLEIEGNDVDFLQNWAMSISPAILELRARPVVMYHGLPDTGDYQWWPNETYVYWPDETYIPFPDD